MITETSKYIQESQKCQRNWNLNKNIPNEDLDLIMKAVTNCPTRQNINFYNVQAITNRDLIEKIHEHTAYFKIDPDMDVSEYSKLISQKSDIKKSDKNWVLKTNPQVLGHLLLAFSANEETYYRDAIDDKWDKDVWLSIGMAAGYAQLISTQLGYASGCCGCYNDQINLLLNRKIRLLVGIGIPDKNRHHTEHHYEPDFRFPSFESVKKLLPVKVDWYNENN